MRRQERVELKEIIQTIFKIHKFKINPHAVEMLEPNEFKINPHAVKMLEPNGGHKKLFHSCNDPK